MSIKKYPPRDYETWEEPVRYISRYFYNQGLRGIGYRIWEEADLSHFWKGSLSDFQRLHMHYAVAICSVDPDAKITYGNVSVLGDFQREMIEYIRRKRSSS